MRDNELSLVKGFAEWFKANFPTISECFTPEASDLFEGSLEDFALELFLELKAEG